MKNWLPVLGMLGLLIVLILPITIHDSIKIKEKLMDKKVILSIFWVVNLIVFTSVLWMGEYYIKHGQEWIETPVHATLFSCGITKIVLSILIVFAWMDDKVVDK